MNARKNKPWVEHNRQDFEAYVGEDYWGELDFPNLEIIELHGDAEVCPSHQSNFFKWNTLAVSSCVYSDMDILYVKPLDTIYDSLNSCDMSINHNGDYFSHGFMSSKGKNLFFRELHMFICRSFNSKCYQGAGSGALYAFLKVLAPEGLHALQKRYPNITIWNFPVETVYPWLSHSIPEYFQQLHEELPEGCIGLHWYAGSPLAQKMNMRITPESVYVIDNTICYHARRFC